MKKVFSFIICLFFLANVQGQTYYYIDDLLTTPNPKSDTDTVRLTLSGDFSDPGSYIQSITVNNSGFNVDVTVDCAHLPGSWIAVLVPFDTTIVLGKYAPGSYHINLQGTSLGVFVQDTNKFNFVVNASNPNSVPLVQHKHQFNYSNPATSTLRLTSTLKDFQWQILDLSGKILLQQEVRAKYSQFDVSALAKGVYIIRFYDDERLLKLDKLLIQ